MKQGFEKRYILDEKLGQGTYGTVYKAYDKQERKEVACKILREKAKQKDKNAFVFEAQLLSRLHHPSIPKYYDFGIMENGHYYFIMEYAKGKTLEEKMQEKDLSLNDAISIFCRLCNTLYYVHSLDVIHNDIKPRNIIITDDNHVVLIDWGSAKLVDKGAIARKERAKQSTKGTPLYIAPELILQFLPSSASDQYALGVILYELLTGDYPFYERDINTLFFRVCCEDATMPMREQLRYDISEPVLKVCLKLLSKKPEERFENCIDVNMALHHAFSQQAIEKQNSFSKHPQQKWFAPPLVSIKIPENKNSYAA